MATTQPTGSWEASGVKATACTDDHPCIGNGAAYGFLDYNCVAIGFEHCYGVWLNDNVDDGIYTFNLKKPFAFHNQVSNRLRISSNGWMTLGDQWDPVSNTSDTHNHYSNDPLPSTSTPNMGIIAPFWDDLYFRSGHVGGLHVYDDGDIIIIEWTNISFYNDAAAKFTFNVVLEYSTGDMFFNYHPSQSMATNSMTVGYEFYGGVDGVEIAYANGTYIYPGAKIKLSSELSGTYGVATFDKYSGLNLQSTAHLPKHIGEVHINTQTYSTTTNLSDWCHGTPPHCDWRAHGNTDLSAGAATGFGVVSAQSTVVSQDYQGNYPPDLKKLIVPEWYYYGGGCPQIFYHQEETYACITSWESTRAEQTIVSIFQHKKDWVGNT